MSTHSSEMRRLQLINSAARPVNLYHLCCHVHHGALQTWPQSTQEESSWCKAAYLLLLSFPAEPPTVPRITARFARWQNIHSPSHGRAHIWSRTQAPACRLRLLANPGVLSEDNYLCHGSVGKFSPSVCLHSCCMPRGIPVMDRPAVWTYIRSTWAESLGTIFNSHSNNPLALPHTTKSL